MSKKYDSSDGSRPVAWRVVRDDRPARAVSTRNPGNVLLDGDGAQTGRERAIDPVGPLALVRVAVVRVQERAGKEWRRLSAGATKGEYQKHRKEPGSHAGI